jgi:hypothetical protein
MSAGQPGGSRTFKTADPAEHERLRLAWDNFEHMLDTSGVVASDLDPADLDYVIADLVSIRHRRLAEVEQDDTIRTTVTEREGELTLESHAYSVDGWDWKRGPLAFADREGKEPDGPRWQPE